MRWNTVLLLTLAGLSPLNQAPLLAVEKNNGSQVSEAQINRHGLTRAWTAQVAMDASRSELKHVVLFVDRTRSYTIHEISYDNRKEYISERDIDANGELLGVEGAKKKLEYRLLFIKAKKPVVTANVIPETLLVCVTSRGMVHVIDAETGRTRWSRLVGNPRFDTLAPAVTENQIGIVCGNNLHLVRTVDGLPQKTIKLSHVAMAGPVISEGWCYIPRIDGTMDWYPVNDQTKLASYFRGTGHLESQASVHPGYVTWMTEKGYLYGLNAFTQKVQFEIKLTGKPVGPPLYAGDYKVIAATRAGYVACIDLRTSTVIWRYSTGEPMVHQPIVAGDYIYATNTTGLITKLHLSTGVNIATGDVAWTASGIQELLAFANNRLYGISTLGELVAIDPASGAIVDHILMDQQDELNIFNPISNRVILANTTGLLQSLRPSSQVFPVFFPGALETAKNGEDFLGKKKPTAGETKKTEAEGTGETPSGGADPFGAPSDKEKAPAGEKAPGADPFGQ